MNAAHAQAVSAGDPVLLDDWHPVAVAASLTPDNIVAARLLGRELALWRSGDGAVHAWEDRCPHRGTRLSIGKRTGEGITCAYHGWHFEADGHCSSIPALPAFAPPARACARVFAAQERYGLVWVCLGQASGDVLPFPEHDDPKLRKVICGPYEVASSGPRIVENFLDMAHFAFVHGGILGDAAHTEVRDYTVQDWDDGSGADGTKLTGPLATQCFAWQPQTNSLAHGGSDVEYTYRVVRPLTAILTKLPQAQADFREAISLHVQPLEETRSRVFIIMAMTNFLQPEQELRAFQDRIFLQDQPILENQVPLRLPLSTEGPEAELAMRCDRMSVAYRRYLLARGLRYGVLA